MLADQTLLNANNKTQKFQVDVYMSVLLMNQAEIQSQQLAYKHLPSPYLCPSAVTLFYIYIYIYLKKCRTDPWNGMI